MSQMKEDFALSTSIEAKNKKGEQSLDGVVTDMNVIWGTANMLNANRTNEQLINSPGSIFSNDVAPVQVERKVY